jgi:hypothetical protein
MNPKRIIVGFDLSRNMKEFSVTISLKMARNLRRGRVEPFKGNAFYHCKMISSKPNGLLANWYRKKHGLSKK